MYLANVYGAIWKSNQFKSDDLYLLLVTITRQSLASITYVEIAIQL